MSEELPPQPALPMIHDAILQMMEEVGSIGKDNKNTQQGYSFRGIDQVYSAIQPLFIKFRVYPTCRLLDMQREQRDTRQGGSLQHSVMTLRYRFTCAVDGSYIETDVIGEGMDSGDKASNKGMSVGYKYAIFQLLCIPTEAVDPDSESPEPAAKGKAAAETPKTTFNDDKKPTTPKPDAKVNGIDVEKARAHLTALKAKPDDKALLAAFAKLKDAEGGQGDAAPAAICELMMLYRKAMDECPAGMERSAEFLRKVPACQGSKAKMAELEKELLKMWDDGLVGEMTYTRAKSVIEAAATF